MDCTDLCVQKDSVSTSFTSSENQSAPAFLTYQLLKASNWLKITPGIYMHGRNIRPFWKSSSICRFYVSTFHPRWILSSCLPFHHVARVFARLRASVNVEFWEARRRLQPTDPRTAFPSGFSLLPASLLYRSPWIFANTPEICNQAVLPGIGGFGNCSGESLTCTIFVFLSVWSRVSCFALLLIWFPFYYCARIESRVTLPDSEWGFRWFRLLWIAVLIFGYSCIFFSPDEYEERIYFFHKEVIFRVMQATATQWRFLLRVRGEWV